jgi:Tfp pilus assembly protein PilV
MDLPILLQQMAEANRRSLAKAEACKGAKRSGWMVNGVMMVIGHQTIACDMDYTTAKAFVAASGVDEEATATLMLRALVKSC